MNPTVREAWRQALLSGEYVQGFTKLHQVTNGVEKFCCLGVLCDLAVRSGVPVVRTRVVDMFFYDSKSGSLPDSVLTWAGLTESLPTGTLGLALSGHNDGQNWSFARIAEVLPL